MEEVRLALGGDETWPGQFIQITRGSRESHCVAVPCSSWDESRLILCHNKKNVFLLREKPLV